MQFRQQVRLADWTTFQVGGPAEWFAEAETEKDVAEGVSFAREHGLRLFVLGGGSNVLVSEAGFPGLVLRMAIRGIRELKGKHAGSFQVAAGEDWDQFVSHVVEMNYAGVECLAGIPGTVGGTPVQNVGAYGQEVAETIRAVRVFDLQAEEFVELSAQECSFSYRHSLFNTTAKGRYIVTRVEYALRSEGKPSLAYADLQKAFVGQLPTLSEVAETVRTIRRKKGMLMVEGDPDCASAGSFFKNPIVSQDLYARIAEQEKVPVPHYSAAEGKVKIPAAWLLERAGFVKGYTLGRAGVSSKHTLALTNRGGATADEIVALRDAILAKVQEQFGIQLEPEPVWVG